MAIKALPNEADLIKQISEGNEKAFEEIFMAYHNPIGQYVLMLTKSHELTEDIVQDVFIKIWNNRRTLNEIQKFTAYLFILTKNYTLNALRKQVNEGIRNELYSADQILEEDSNEPNYGERYSGYEMLDEAIGHLPPQQKIVFSLRMEGLKNPAIASQMNISPGSVKKYQQYALKTIIKYVKGYNLIPFVFIFLFLKD